MFRMIISVFALAATLAACAGESGSLGAPSNGTNAVTKPVANDGCFIYPLYSVGECSTLVKRSTFTGSLKSDYTYKSSSDRRYKAPSLLIDLQRVQLNQQITRNFKLSEYMATHKGRYGYTSEHTFTLVQKIRDDLGVPLRVNSGYRSPAYNRKIGGASLSRHMYGDGVDLGSSAGVRKIQAACRAAGASYIQVYTDGHVHCDWRSHRLDDTFVPNVSGATVTPMQVAAMSETDFARMQEEIGGKPVVSIAGDAKVGATIELEAELEEQEDPGEALTEWIVLRPDGARLDSEGNPLVLHLEQSGTYQILFRVGGYAESSQTIDVK